MNWNGGKLQRHAKARPDAQKKAQKRYFARARQRPSSGTVRLSPPSLAHYQNTVSNEPLPSPRLDVPHSHHLSDEREDKPSRLVAHSTSQKGRGNPVAPSSDPLDRVKRRLLNTTDWTGLSTARPLQMTFQSASDMQNIIGRRRVSKTNSHRNRAIDCRPVRHEKKVQALALGKSPSYDSGLRDQDCSIRLGSNIHQTQTTGQCSVYRPLSSEAAFPSDPMVLDQRFSASPKLPSAGQAHILHRNYEPHGDTQNVLVPLNQALDLKSFDEVKDRSSSMVRQISTSSNPFVIKDGAASTSAVRMDDDLGPDAPSRPEQQTRQDCTTVPAFNDTLQRDRKEPATNGHHDKSYTDVHTFSRTNLRDRQAEEPPLLMASEARSNVSEEEGLKSSHQYPGSNNHIPRQTPPRFTIDDQVLLEKQFLPSPNHPRSDKANSHQSPYPSSDYSNVSLQGKGGSAGNLPFEMNEPPAKRRRIFEPVAISSGGSQFEPPLGLSSSRSAMVTIGATPLRQTRHQQRSAAALQVSPAPLKGSKSPKSLSDENEAWMKYVFPHDFQRMQDGFSFSPVVSPASKKLSTIESWTSEEHPVFTWRRSPNPSRPRSRRSTSSVTSVPTNVNTAFFSQVAHVSTPAQSETDFLSRFSPMEAVLEDRLEPISTYGNAAKSARSYISLPSSTTRQSVAPDVTDRLSFTSANNQLPAIPARRKALQPLLQPRLWGHLPFNERVSQVSRVPSTPREHYKSTSRPSLHPRNFSLALPPGSQEQGDHTKVITSRAPQDLLLPGHEDLVVRSPALQDYLSSGRRRLPNSSSQSDSHWSTENCVGLTDRGILVRHSPHTLYRDTTL